MCISKDPIEDLMDHFKHATFCAYAAAAAIESIMNQYGFNDEIEESLLEIQTELAEDYEALRRIHFLIAAIYDIAPDPADKEEENNNIVPFPKQ